MSSRHGKPKKWTFKAHGLVAKPFEHARERERVVTSFKKREREREREREKVV